MKLKYHGAQQLVVPRKDERMSTTRKPQLGAAIPPPIPGAVLDDWIEVEDSVEASLAVLREIEELRAEDSD